MQLEERPRGETVVIDLHGSLNKERGDPTALLARVRALANHGYKCIILNVEDLTEVDSLTMGTIAHAYISTNRIGAALKLLHVTPKLQHLLEITKLNRAIESVDSEDTPAHPRIAD